MLPPALPCTQRSTWRWWSSARVFHRESATAVARSAGQPARRRHWARSPRRVAQRSRSAACVAWSAFQVESACQRNMLSSATARTAPADSDGRESQPRPRRHAAIRPPSAVSEQIPTSRARSSGDLPQASAASPTTAARVANRIVPPGTGCCGNIPAGTSGDPALVCGRAAQLWCRVPLIPRLHLLEIHDQSWCPVAVRDGITDLIQTGLGWFRAYDAVVSLLARALRRTDARRVVDLASGGGGPWPRFLGLLAREGAAPSVILTDRFPNHRTLERLRAVTRGALDFHPGPVDATAVPRDLAGFRTLFT